MVGANRFRPARLAPPRHEGDNRGGSFARKHHKARLYNFVNLMPNGSISTIALFTKECILCYAIVLPGPKSAFRAGFRPDSLRESLKIGPPAGLRPARGPISSFVLLESDRNPSRKTDSRPGSTIA